MASKMYETATPLDLHRLSRQSLHKRYESDEEDVSESDTGGQDFEPSLVESHADENSHTDPDSDREEHLLAPFPPGKSPRPLSMDTVKRSSNATFADDAYVFDPEEEMVLDLPSPDSPPIASSLFLQPAIYVSPNSPDSPPTSNRNSNSNSRTRSPSPSSIFSVENAEIQVAKKVTMVEPPTRPALVFINSLNTRSKSSRPRSSHSRTRGNPRDRGSRMFPERTDSKLEVPRLIETKSTPSRDSSKGPTERKEHSSSSSSSSQAMPSLNEEQPSSKQTATINRVSEIPAPPHIPPSPHLTPEPTPRPRTAGSEKPFPTLASVSRSRRPTELAQRPSSLRSTSNNSIPSNSHSPGPASPHPVDDPRQGYLADHNSDAASLLSQTSSPVSTTSSPPPAQSQRDKPQDHTNSPTYNLTNILAHKSPLMRRMTKKHSASSSIHSLNSLRSEIISATSTSTTAAAITTTTNTAAATSQPSLNTMHHDSHVVRKPSQRRHARHNSSAFGGRSFMGLKIGKRSFARTFS